MAGFWFFVAVFVVVGAAIIYNYLEKNKPVESNKNFTTPPKAQ
jgi:hypothetical protein